MHEEPSARTRGVKYNMCVDSSVSYTKTVEPKGFGGEVNCKEIIFFGNRFFERAFIDEPTKVCLMTQFLASYTVLANMSTPLSPHKA